jgi:ankyrin repeat protein
VILDRHAGRAALLAIWWAMLSSAGHAQPAPGKSPPTLDEALVIAVDQGNAKAVPDLLRSGANPNARNRRGMTVLQVAVVGDRREAAELLVKAGADVNLKSLQGGNSPLWIAAFWGRAELLRLFLANKGEVNARAEGGMTPLMIAAFVGHVNAMEVLLKNGADINNAKDDLGRTALWLAVQGRNTNAAIQLLLEKGANPNEKNKEGQTMVERATRDNKPDVVALLRKHGAK